LVGVATQALRMGPLNLPGVGPAEAIGLYVAARAGSAVLVALSWCMGYAVVRAVERAIAAESRRLHAEIELGRQATLAGEARLAALHARLQPHFLFNAMNTIRALIAEDPDTARRAVTDLSFLIRETLHASDAREHPLDGELRIVQRYLSLEALRFGARMQWRIDADAAGAAFALLQTLVENAVKHGVGRQLGTVEIVVRIAGADGRARIEVANTGTLPATRGEGRGLVLSRERLRLLYGEDSHLSLEATADHAAVVAVAEWTPRAAGVEA
jgi:LytS/YehU family sensor histidine kinase